MHIDPSKGSEKRGIEPFRAKRSYGDADLQPKEGRKKKKIRRPMGPEAEEKWADSKQSGKIRSRRLRIILVLAACLVAVGALVGIRMSRDGNGAASFHTPDREDFLGSVFPDIPALVPEEGVAMAQRLLAARNETEVEELILPGKMSASDAVAFLKTFPHAAEIHWVGSLHSHHVPAMALIVVPVRGPLGVVFFRPAGDDSWKIDFDAFARYSDSPVGGFMDGTSGEGTFRLVAASDHYYNGAYGDEREWRCFTLKSPDHEAVLYGYCRRGSDQEKALAKLEEFATIRGNDKGIEVAPGDAVSYRTTLAIERKPGGGDARQVEIVSVVAEDWLVTDVDYDQRYDAAGE